MADRTFLLKLRRAREHAKLFDEAVQWWVESEPYRIVEDVDPETDTKEIAVVVDRPLGPRLSLMYGDAIQNFRSCLDYLVGDLARSNAGGHLMPRVESDLQFPITTKRSNFKGAIRQGRLGCVHARPAALIQKLQPYRRGQDPATHPLWALQQLSNIDKHRRIPLMTSVVKALWGQNIEIPGHVAHFTYGQVGPFKDRAVIASYSPSDAVVNMDFGSILIGTALGEGLPGVGQEPGGVLATIVEQVIANVIEPLATYL
jgi:hypothetical protein